VKGAVSSEPLKLLLSAVAVALMAMQLIVSNGLPISVSDKTPLSGSMVPPKSAGLVVSTVPLCTSSSVSVGPLSITISQWPLRSTLAAARHAAAPSMTTARPRTAQDRRVLPIVKPPVITRRQAPRHAP
jgi:hypothetical protein